MINRIRLCIIIILSALSYTTIAQSYDPSKINKRAVQLYEQAMQRAEDGNLTLATGLLLQAVKTDDKYVDAYIALGSVYGQLRNHRNSIEYYEKAFALDSVYTLDNKLSYSVQLAASGRFQDALDAVNTLLSRKPPKNENALKACLYRQRCYTFAVNWAREHPQKNYLFNPRNLGKEINTAESEYFPSLSIDGNEFVFTRRVKNVNEDFYVSSRAGEGWSVAQPMAGDVNTPGNEAAQNISQDGQWLVFTASDRPDNFGNFDLYISYLTDKGWSAAVNLGRNVNSDQWDSQPCLSPDKKDLYFTSRRPGGYGGSDIWVCHLQPNGSWSSPENLGPTINSAEDEQCPFIHADNQTLYFASSFWPGYGDEDLFVVRKTSSGWSKPENLGYPINTIDKEGTLFIAADGKTAFYASDKSDSRGGTDIYSFELREDVRPLKTLWVKGQVTDKKSGKAIQSIVELADPATRQIVSRVATDETGKYLVTLPVGRDYAFNVSKPGYLFYSDRFMLASSSPDSAYTKNIQLQPLEVNAMIVLQNVFFDVNRFDLQPASQGELDRIVQLMKDNPALKIEISGHTDNTGKPADNLKLSNDRAKAVVTYISSKGIAINRLLAKGYGDTKPAAPNTTEAGRALNRRTEMRITAR